VVLEQAGGRGARQELVALAVAGAGPLVGLGQQRGHGRVQAPHQLGVLAALADAEVVLARRRAHRVRVGAQVVARLLAAQAVAAALLRHAHAHAAGGRALEGVQRALGVEVARARAQHHAALLLAEYVQEPRHHVVEGRGRRELRAGAAAPGLQQVTGHVRGVAREARGRGRRHLALDARHLEPDLLDAALLDAELVDAAQPHRAPPVGPEPPPRLERVRDVARQARQDASPAPPPLPPLLPPLQLPHHHQRALVRAPQLALPAPPLAPPHADPATAAHLRHEQPPRGPPHPALQHAVQPLRGLPHPPLQLALPAQHQHHQTRLGYSTVDHRGVRLSFLPSRGHEGIYEGRHSTRDRQRVRRAEAGVADIVADVLVRRHDEAVAAAAQAGLGVVGHELEQQGAGVALRAHHQLRRVDDRPEALVQALLAPAPAHLAQPLDVERGLVLRLEQALQHAAQPLHARAAGVRVVQDQRALAVELLEGRLFSHAQSWSRHPRSPPTNQFVAASLHDLQRPPLRAGLPQLALLQRGEAGVARGQVEFHGQQGAALGAPVDAPPLPADQVLLARLRLREAARAVAEGTASERPSPPPAPVLLRLAVQHASSD
ncbi:hypothetical protein FIBSPDRAFT_956842, partial [Athelia psychrophila]